MPALWIPAALGVATTVVLNGRLLDLGDVFWTASTALPGVAVVVVVSLLVFLAGRRAAWALAALVVVTAVDLGVYGLGFVRREPPRRLVELIGRIPQAPAHPADAYAAAPDEGPFRSNLIVMRGYRLTTGYVGLFPASRHPLGSEEALRLAGTLFLFTTEGTRLPFKESAARIRLLDDAGQPASGLVTLAVDRPARLVAHVEAPARRSWP